MIVTQGVHYVVNQLHDWYMIRMNSGQLKADRNENGDDVAYGRTINTVIRQHSACVAQRHFDEVTFYLT